MNTIFANVVYVVSATKDGQSEFWAAATPRQRQNHKYSDHCRPDGKPQRRVGGSAGKGLQNWKCALIRCEFFMFKYCAALHLTQPRNRKFQFDGSVAACAHTQSRILPSRLQRVGGNGKVASARVLGKSTVVYFTARIRFRALPCSQGSNSPIIGSRACDASHSLRIRLTLARAMPALAARSLCPILW